MKIFYYLIFNEIMLCYNCTTIVGSEGAKNLKARFEDFAKSSEEEDRKRATEERTARLARERKEKEESKAAEQVKNWKQNCFH